MNFYGGSVEGIVNFDTQCATFTFYTLIRITSLFIVYNAKFNCCHYAAPCEFAWWLELDKEDTQWFHSKL